MKDQEKGTFTKRPKTMPLIMARNQTPGDDLQAPIQKGDEKKLMLGTDPVFVEVTDELGSNKFMGRILTFATPVQSCQGHCIGSSVLFEESDVWPHGSDKDLDYGTGTRGG